MTRSDLRTRLVAICLALLAGYVDAVGFLRSGGFFVSFMSGNSTRAGVGLATQGAAALMAFGLIAAFVTGVTLSTLLARRLGARRPMVLLLLIALVLGLAALSAPVLPLPLTLLLIACAMGAENVVLAGEEEVQIGVTYMTGALVRMGQGIAVALSGGDRWRWTGWAILWAGLVTGAVLGALACTRFGSGALWGGAAMALALAVLVGRIKSRRVPMPHR